MESTPAKPRVHVGVYETVPQADRAVWELVHSGIPKEQITVICPTCTHEKYSELDKQEPTSAHAAAGAATGAATGGAIGVLLGGLVAGAVAASGGTAILVAGPLLLASGTGAMFGGFVGAMMSRGLDREVADFYDQALEKGQVLVAVEEGDGVTHEHVSAADRIFASTGSEFVTLRKS